MNIGFTGTRHGMTEEQKARLSLELLHIRQEHTSIVRATFHHGDCIGADYEAAAIAYRNGYRVILHPPVDVTQRAYSTVYSEDRKPKTYFARNRDIVNESDMLISCPQYMEAIAPETKGGTAYTVNYARKVGKPVIIIRPDGTSERYPAQ